MSKPLNFFEIKDEAVIAKLFEVSVKIKNKFTLWLKDQEIKFESPISFYFQRRRRLSLDFPQSMTANKLLTALEKQGSNQILGSFQIQTTHFFFKTDFVTATPGHKFEITTPKTIFKLQRRANLRIEFSRRQAPKLTVMDPALKLRPTKTIDDSMLLSYRVIDISAGGLGIAAPIEDEQKLAAGTKLHDMRFKLRGMELIADGMIRFAAKKMSDQDKPMLRIGIQFSQLKPEFERHIAKFVLDESRTLFTLLS